MIYYRPSHERGHSRLSWLDSYHSFSFADFYDPEHMGFSSLRVINDDTVAPAAGFDLHSHRDMEIVSYILEGEIVHRDTLGNHFVVPAGDVQRMTAGTGIWHSEYNNSSTEPLRFLQIWIKPDRKNLSPGYQQQTIIQDAPLVAIVTPDGRNGSLRVHQDASIYRLRLEPGEKWQFENGQRPGYLHILKGCATFADLVLGAGDGLGLIGERAYLESSNEGMEALWFDLNPVANH